MISKSYVTVTWPWQMWGPGETHNSCILAQSNGGNILQAGTMQDYRFCVRYNTQQIVVIRRFQAVCNTQSKWLLQEVLAPCETHREQRKWTTPCGGAIGCLTCRELYLGASVADFYALKKMYQFINVCAQYQPQKDLLPSWPPSPAWGPRPTAPNTIC